MKKLFNNKKLISFLLPFLIILIAILPNIIINNGIFFLDGDYILQEVPFNILINKLFKSGEYYSWIMDLGTNAYSAFSLLASSLSCLAIILISSSYEVF